MILYKHIKLGSIVIHHVNNFQSAIAIVCTFIDRTLAI